MGKHSPTEFFDVDYAALWRGIQEEANQLRDRSAIESPAEQLGNCLITLYAAASSPTVDSDREDVTEAGVTLFRAYRELAAANKRIGQPLHQVDIALQLSEGWIGWWDGLLNPTPSKVSATLGQLPVVIHGDAIWQLWPRVQAKWKADSNGQTDKPADKTKVIPKVPRNPLVYKLISEINRRKATEAEQLPIAIELAERDETKAKNLLRQVRRFKHLLS